MPESESDQEQFIPVAEMADMEETGRIYLDIDATPVVIIKIGDQIFAMEDLCTHDDGPLGDGEVDGYHIICPRHGARFDVRTGEVVTPPAVVNVRVFPVRVVGTTIEIGIR